MDSYAFFQEYLQLDHQIDEFYHSLAQGQGLSDSAFQILWILTDLGDGCTQRDICRWFSLSKQTVHSSVRKLEREGLLSLRPKEGREVSLHLTARGRELVQEKILPAIQAERAAAQGLSREEWAILIRITRKWFTLFQEAASSIPKT